MPKEYDEKLLRRFYKYGKKIKFYLKKPYKNTTPIFIMGSGRSGTTMMINIFHRDCRVEALDENDPNIAQNYILKMDKVPNVIKASKASFLVMKPILNSFDAKDLLKAYANAKVIWMLRNYKDVIASSIIKFDTVVSDYMKEYVLHGIGSNWITKGLPADTRGILSALKTSEFSCHSWMALVWWAVNRTIILDDLIDSDRFYLVNYESLVRSPAFTLENIYKFINLKYQKKTTRFIHASSIEKGKTIEIHPQVDNLCKKLIFQINRKCQKHSEMSTSLSDLPVL